MLGVQLITWAHPLLAADLDTLLTGYSLTSWNDGDGRPLGTVHAIVQADDGYLWVGSDGGLFLFDGSRFLPWEFVGDSPLPESVVTALCVLRDGSVLIGFADGGGVRRIRDGRVQPQDQGGERLGYVSNLVEDHSGTIWAVADGSLYKLLRGYWQRVSLVWMAREASVRQAFVSKDGELWVGTEWGVFRRSNESSTFQRMAAGHIWGISEDMAGIIWTTDNVAGFRSLGPQASPQHALAGAGYRLMHDRKGNLWVATFGEGLWRVGVGSATGAVAVERAALRTGLSSDSVQSLAEDRDGNIWVGTTGGLHRLTQRKLTPVENFGFVVAVEPAGNARVWVGRTNGVVQLSTLASEWRQGQSNSPGPDVRSLYSDSRGKLWVGATDGLYQLINGDLVSVALPSRSHMPVTSISPDGRGGLWLGDGVWLYRWDGASLVKFADAPDWPDLKRITFAHGDKSGRVWIGFAGGRLGLVDRDGTFQTFGQREGLGPTVHQTIYAVLEDEEGVVWIGGNGGLSWFTHGRFATVTHENGLPGNRVRAIVEDLQGHLWLSVDRGLVGLDRNEIRRAVDDPSYRVRYRLYDTFDGLAGAPTGIIGSARAGDGTLWLVRGGGLTLLDPRTLDDNHPPAPPPVRIDGAIANERRFRMAQRTSFPPGTGRLQINYTALALTAPNKIRFRYRLDGVDTSWVDAGSRRVAFYTNLSPRSYRFVVESSTEDGTWNTSTAAWDFAIQPAFYQAIWFYAACSGIVGFGLWATWRFRLGLVERQFSLVLSRTYALEPGDPRHSAAKFSRRDASV